MYGFFYFLSAQLLRGHVPELRGHAFELRGHAQIVRGHAFEL